MQYIAPVFYYKKNCSHVLHLKWQNCEIYIAVISAVVPTCLFQTAVFQYNSDGFYLFTFYGRPM